MQVSLSHSEVSIEDRFYYYLLAHFQTFNVLTYNDTPSSSLNAIGDPAKVDELFIPIDVFPWTCNVVVMDYCVVFRTFKVASLQFVLNTHWSLVHLNHSLIGLPEFENNNVTLYELGQNAFIHYYKGLQSNAGSVIVSIEQLGAPINFMRFVQRGLNIFISKLIRGFDRGLVKFIVDLGKGLFSIVKHVALGMFYTTWCLANGWSRTLNTFQSVKCVKYGLWPVIRVLNAAKPLSETVINYILNSMDNGEEIN